jgi:alpha-beta hydrolase superfamily lysophospholipase
METKTIQSADGTALHLKRTESDTGANGDVLLVHGLGEHIGRYDHVFARLNRAGYRVTGFDFRGHGNSEGKRGHVDHWSEYVADLEAAAAQIPGDYSVVAHSMGAFVTLCALRSGLSHRPRKAVLSGPPLGVAIEPPKWKIAAAGLLSRLLPRLSMSNEIDSELICRDPEVVSKYNADPAVFGTITPRWYTELVAQQALVHAHAAKYTDQILLLVGSDDRLCAPEASERFAERAGDNIAFKSYEGLYHEILNEYEKDEILDEIVSWLESDA